MTDEHEIETDPDRPLDDGELWLEEEYFPHILPSFPPFEYVDRTERITFEDTFGLRCVVGAGEITAAFLALVDNGILPPVKDTWRDRIADDLEPEKMLARSGPVALPLPPEREQAGPNQYPAQFIGLAIHEDTLGCPRCGTRAHAILRTPVSEHRITECNVVAAMNQLARANAMPPLSDYWQSQMNERYAPPLKAHCVATQSMTSLLNTAQTPHTTPQERSTLGIILTHDLEKIEAGSPFKDSASPDLFGGSDTPVMTPNGKSVCQIVTENADLLIGIVVDDTGILPGSKLIRTLFRAFFDNRLYLRPAITPGNAPWLLFGGLRTWPLYGQVIQPASDTAKAILRKVPAARISHHSRLEARPGRWTDIRFQLYRHRISGDEPPCETVELMIFLQEAQTGDRTLILQKTIRLRPETFLRQVKTRETPTPSGRKNIDIAREELHRHITQHPHLE